MGHEQRRGDFSRRLSCKEAKILDDYRFQVSADQDFSTSACFADGSSSLLFKYQLHLAGARSIKPISTPPAEQQGR
jgi:hypothetical protein